MSATEQKCRNLIFFFFLHIFYTIKRSHPSSILGQVQKCLYVQLAIQTIVIALPICFSPATLANGTRLHLSVVCRHQLQLVQCGVLAFVHLCVLIYIALVMYWAYEQWLCIFQSDYVRNNARLGGHQLHGLAKRTMWRQRTTLREVR